MVGKPIEMIVIDYLIANEIDAYAEIPEGKIKYALVDKTGSNRENLVDSATIIIQSVDETKAKACIFNEEIKELMENIVRLPEISRCELNSDYSFNDTKTKRYRYQAVYEITKGGTYAR